MDLRILRIIGFKDFKDYWILRIRGFKDSGLGDLRIRGFED